MTIIVVTPEHGEQEFSDAGWWETHTGNEDWLDEGHLWVAKTEDSDEAVAEFAKGAWLFVYETKDEPTEAQELAEDEIVWKNGLDEFPQGTPVWSEEDWLAGVDDNWFGEGPGGFSYRHRGPFTATPPKGVCK